MHNFNDLKVELQLQIAEFLGLSPDDLALVDLSSMLQGTSVINELTKEAGGVRVVEEVMVDMPLCIDCVDPEWQEIPAVKNPQGCCIIS